jgi:hypothetical protein
MLEIEKVSAMSDEMRAVVESEWHELAHKLPPAAIEANALQAVRAGQPVIMHLESVGAACRLRRRLIEPPSSDGRRRSSAWGLAHASSTMAAGRGW